MAAVKFSIGRQRISRNLNPAEAHYTTQIRAQMQAILKNAKKVIDSIDAQSPEALEYALKPIFDESQRLVPVKTGKLKRSGYIRTRRSAHGATGEVGYAQGGDPHYGVYVHEFTERFHEPPTQAKFLQEPARSHAPEIPLRYAEYIRVTLGL